MTRVFIIVIFLFTNLIALENKKLKVVYPKNFPPSYIFINGKPSGYGLELFEEIKKDLNLKVEYLPQESWREVFTLMESGEADIIPNQGITEYRKKFMNYSQEVQSINIALFSLKGKKVLGIESLSEKKVGVIKANVAYKILKKYKDIDVIAYDDENHFFDDFIDGHLDFIAYTEPAIISLAKGRDSLRKIEKNFDLTVIHRGIAVHKDKKELLEKINETIDKLKKTGKLDEIYHKWHKEEKKYTKEEITKFLLVLLFLLIVIPIYLKYKKIILTKNELEKEVERKTQLLKESKEKFEFATNKALSGYGEWNLDKDKIICSDGWYEILGLDKNEFKPSTESIFNLIHIDDRQITKIKIDELIKNKKETFSHEFRFKVKDKDYLWVHALGTIYENINKEKIFFGFLLDINDKKSLEAKRREQENMILHQSKMAAMGEMLENIAHQWRQPLSMISTSATGVEFQKEIGILKDEYLVESLKNINEATQYLSTTIDDFRNYFSSNKIIDEFDLKKVIKRVVRLVSPKFKNVDISLVIDSQKIEIYNLENELIQVLINILNNSKDALENLDLEKKLIFINTYKNDDTVFIEIKDNAGGIKEELIEKIFEPYFTTKHKTQGTGLGLFMCTEILNKHMNGNISVKNVEFEYEDVNCKGANFTIELKNL